MSKFQNRADLLIAAGESIKMQESFGIIPVGKHIGSGPWALKDYRFVAGDEWEFPISVVEGKAVFVGDELYDGAGEKHFAPYVNKIPSLPKIEMAFPEHNKWSWNQPKPATVMVELSREDAEYFADTIKTNTQLAYMARVAECCRKALEEK